MIETPFKVEFETSNKFREIFSKVLQSAISSVDMQPLILKASWFDTALGPMFAITDDTALLLLEFVDGKGLEFKVIKLRKKMNASIIFDNCPVLSSIENEIKAYFAGNLKKFNTPIRMLGSAFQNKVWHALTLISYGETKSYAEQAQKIEQPTAYRAVANANGENPLAIIVPCHRIINSNGNLGGYGGGLFRKKWLLELEQNNK